MRYIIYYYYPQTLIGMTALHLATKWSKLDLLQKIWDWAEEKLQEEEITNKLLLATDSRGRTVIHVAAKRDHLHILQNLWEWAKENSTTEEMNNTSLSTTNRLVHGSRRG
jgi:ankyrin repeat protein